MGGCLTLSDQILGRRRLLDTRRLAARLVALASGLVIIWAALAGVLTGALSTFMFPNMAVPLSALSDILFVAGVLVLVGVLMLFLSNTGGHLVLVGGALSIVMGVTSLVTTGYMGQAADIAGLVALGSGIVAVAIGTRRDLLQNGWPIHLIER